MPNNLKECVVYSLINLSRGAMLLVVLILFYGCSTSGYEKFYTQVISNEELQELRQDSKELLYSDVKLYSTSRQNLQNDFEALRHCRYVGYSSFNGALEDSREIKIWAVRVSANVALAYQEYTDTASMSGVYHMPKTTTTYHSGSANAYGSGGWANGTYSGTTTTYGTTAIPYSYSVRRYDQFAAYFFCDN